MEVVKWKDLDETQVEKASYKGKMNPVKGFGIRWLSRCGDDGTGRPTYGLRYFTAAPGADLPIHSHLYAQTMFFLSGRFECFRFDPETDALLEKATCGPGDSVYVPGMEPHGMKNLSDAEPGSFLCCIGTVPEG